MKPNHPIISRVEWLAEMSPDLFGPEASHECVYRTSLAQVLTKEFQMETTAQLASKSYFLISFRRIQSSEYLWEKESSSAMHRSDPSSSTLPPPILNASPPSVSADIIEALYGSAQDPFPVSPIDSESESDPESGSSESGSDGSAMLIRDAVNEKASFSTS
jgi:hypothetical protein